VANEIQTILAQGYIERQSVPTEFDSGGDTLKVSGMDQTQNYGFHLPQL